MIGHECGIRPGARIDHSTIGDRCIIGDDVTIVNSIIMSGATIGKGVSISDSIIGKIVFYLLSKVHLGYLSYFRVFRKM